MAIESNVGGLSYPAGVALNTSQYLFMKLNASGQIIPCSVAGEASIGVLQDAPLAIGRAGAVSKVGMQTKVLFGAAVTAGAKMTTDATGKAITAATGNIELGTCTEGGSVGQVGSILFVPGRTAP
jgi:hypothetical protein